MEALIHHFKLVTEGFRVPPGEVYVPIESPRGELGCFVLSDGSSKPARVHMRDPSFANLQSLKHDGRGRPDRRPDRLHRDARPDPRRDRPVTNDPGGRSPTSAEIDVPQELQAEIEELMSRYPDHHSAALPALAAAQRLHGWCSPEAIDQVAAVMQVTPAYLSSVATFYDMLNTEPVGRHYVWVCTSVACMPKNAKAVYDAIKEAGGDLDDVHIREFECLGACDMAPMASVNGRYIGPLQPGDAEQIVEALEARRAAAAGKGARAMAEETRVLLEHIDEPGLATIDVYERLGGYSRLRKALIEMEQEELVHELEASGLRGRGGAGFSMGKKASFIPKGAMDKYLCCNADESEPGTFKDRLLMQKNPHLLIEGIIIAARAAGANRAFIFIRGEYELQAQILEKAVEEAKAKGYVGERILGSDFSLELWVHRGAGRLHLRRGVGAARRARGQARQPAPQAAVPREPGPLPGPDADQQRRDALQRPADRREGRGLVQVARHREVDRHEDRLGLRATSSGPATTRSSSASPRASIVYGLAGGPPEGREIKCWFPGGSSAPVLLPEDLDLPVRLREHGRGRLDARLGRDHRDRRLGADRRRRAAARRVLPPRVVRQVHAVPRGHELDREDARAHRPRRGHADGHRDHRPGPGRTSSATACACSATRWRCRSAR